jgi:hypothetical protein
LIRIKEILMTIKNWALAAALLSLAVFISCSSAHSPTLPIEVTVSLPNGITVLYVNQSSVQVTATVVNTTNKSVTWSVQQNGTDCTNNPSVCGSFSSTTANPTTYTAPSTPQSVTFVATSQADPSKSGSLDISIIAIAVQVTPYASSVGVGLSQQYTAVVVPDDAPQGVSWSLSACSNGPCGPNPDANGVYTATGANPGATATIQASANSPLSGIGTAPANIVLSRLTPSTSFAFRFSGFDSNTHLARVSAGIFNVDSTGKKITGGTWDEVTSGGPQPCTFSSGSFTPNSNNQGTLSLVGLCNGGARTPVYNVVFDAGGDIQMIETDSSATGSGIIEPVTGKFNSLGALNGTFVFGATGVDLGTRARTGYVGALPMNGAGNIGSSVAGLMDTNDGGSADSASNVTGTYSLLSNGIYSMTITSSLGSFNFRLYGVSGQLNVNNPTTLYAISTDANPGVIGTVVYQDSKLSFNNTDLNNTSIISLTGADNNGSNVSLTRISPDKKGNFSGGFDQNDAGTIQSVNNLSNTYNATGGGRLTINLLGNSSGTPKGIPFVLYLNAANSGFLLDQSSGSVLTGTMTPQLPKGNSYSPSVVPGTYALATIGSATSSVDPIAGNGLLTWVNTGSCTSQCASATIYDSNNPSGVAVSGTYTIASTGAGGLGAGGSSIVLTTPNKQNFVIYVLDAFDYTNPTKGTNHFLMFEEDSGVNNASIVNVQQ